jgi:hypothetical protein
MSKVIKLTEKDLTNLVNKIVSETKEKSTIKEGFEFTIPGGSVRGTGDVWPEIVVSSSDTGIAISQKIGKRTEKVILSKKQIKELIKVLS